MTRHREVAVVPVDMEALELGEGARWLDGGPVQVDLLAGRLLRVQGARAEVVLELGVPLGAVAPRVGGGLVAIAGAGVRLLDDLHDDDPVLIETGEDPDAMRVNDAATDAQGRLWFGVMPYVAGNHPCGALWRLDPDLTLTRVRGGLTVPNGPVVDVECGTLYLADSPRGVIQRHRLDARTGALGPAETFATVAVGSPDGMALDSEGGLWSAVWGESCLHRYAPGGRLTDVVMLPASQPTSLALDPRGGPALVTTASYGLDAPGPLDGRSLWVDLGVSGEATRRFGRP